jgi:SulP family sulfate permease
MRRGATLTKASLRLDQLLSTVTVGLIAAIVSILIETSLAALVFSGPLSDFVSTGVGLFLFGTTVLSLVTALGSSYAGSVSVCQDSPAAMTALMAVTLAQQELSSVPPDVLVATLIALIAVTSLVMGLVAFGLGAFRLGDLVRYIPYPVVGGFLVSTGWFLLQGGFGVMTGTSLTLTQLPDLIRPDMVLRWLPGLVFGALLLAVLRRHSHFLIIPLSLLGAIGLFYLVLTVTGTPIAQAEAAGWLLGPFPERGLWRPLGPATLRQVDWRLIGGQVGNVVTISFISVVSLLLNATGIELLSGEDVDLNRELRAAGAASFLAGLGGGPTGYTSVSLTVLGFRAGVNSRLVGVISALLCAAVLWGGASAVSFFPRPVIGGLLCFLGLGFLVEWLVDAWFQLPRFDYATVVAILVVMATVGVLEGVAVGLALAGALFVINYSRVDPVRAALTGTTYHSTVERPRLYRRLLREKGDWVRVLELQGFIFFGTANALLERVRHYLYMPADASGVVRLRPRYVILDFRRVTGLDTSAVMSFVKMKHLVRSCDAVLLFAGLSPTVRRQLTDQVLPDDARTEEHGGGVLIRPDLDHALEWCETEMLKVFDDVGLARRPRPFQADRVQSPEGERVGHLLDALTGQVQTAADSTLLISDLPDLPDISAYLEREEIQEGHTLIAQGEADQGLYLLASGRLTAQTIGEDGTVMRLRTVQPGAILGEISTYLGVRATATVLADQPSIIYRLRPESLRQMEMHEPQVAAAFHRQIAQLLSERLAGTTETLQALLP